MEMGHRTFPAALLLDGRECLVVGSGGEVAARSRTLLDSGARVRVVGERPDRATRDLTGDVQLFERAYVSDDMQGVWLAVLCDFDRDLAMKMGIDARSRRTFFCAIDQPEHNGFSHVAVVREGDLQIAISTGGKAPALARRLREELSRILQEANAAEAVDRLAKLRASTPRERRREVMAEAVAAVRFVGRLELGEDG